MKMHLQHMSLRYFIERRENHREGTVVNALMFGSEEPYQAAEVATGDLEVLEYMRDLSNGTLADG